MGAIDANRGAMRQPNLVQKTYGPVSYVAVLKLLWRRYCERASMRRSREALRTMTDEQLRDIGITRADAQAELRKN